MKRFLATVLFLTVALCATGAQAKKSAAQRRAEIDKTANETLARLYKERSDARTLKERSYGYAVFDQTQTAFMISGGGGTGVAVEAKSGKRIYMRMASGGVGVGLGVQMMFTVFLFETKAAFDNFTVSGLDADTSASAAAGTAGKNAQASFSNGIAVFQLTDKGLIAQASLKGTKYWQDDKLNAKE